MPRVQQSQIEEELIKQMQADGTQRIPHNSFLDLIAPSFVGVEC